MSQHQTHCTPEEEADRQIDREAREARHYLRTEEQRVAIQAHLAEIETAIGAKQPYIEQARARWESLAQEETRATEAATDAAYKELSTLEVEQGILQAEVEALRDELEADQETRADWGEHLGADAGAE